MKLFVLMWAIGMILILNAVLIVQSWDSINTFEQLNSANYNVKHSNFFFCELTSQDNLTIPCSMIKEYPQENFKKGGV